MSEGSQISPVARGIGFSFVSPEFRVRLGRGPAVLAVVEMPETSVNVDHAAAGGEYQIWLARKIFDVKSVAISQPMHNGSYFDFRARVTGSDISHVAVALLGRKYICHGASGGVIEIASGRLRAHEPSPGQQRAIQSVVRAILRKDSRR